ncbi:hypothetical protein C4D60_Mb02t01930 [Musa balbisiana]|uniref:Uncharacterized protein n=1 Tax=Musa balbisiana TaxID=52838 RepID=A0A4S8I8G3_MUSBA|nr:hypothetical protein C4D60_Mb02t01930 [Musa balbisiana]
MMVGFLSISASAHSIMMDDVSVPAINISCQEKKLLRQRRNSCGARNYDPRSPHPEVHDGAVARGEVSEGGVGHGTDLRQRAEDWDARWTRRERELADGMESAAEEKVDKNAQEDAGDENNIESHGDGGGALGRCHCQTEQCHYLATERSGGATVGMPQKEGGAIAGSGGATAGIDVVMGNKGMKSLWHSRWLDIMFERLNSEEGEHVVRDGLGFLGGGQAVNLEEAVDAEVGVALKKREIQLLGAEQAMTVAISVDRSV